MIHMAVLLLQTLHEFRSTCVADGAREVYYTHYSTVEAGESVLSGMVLPLSGSAPDLWGTQPTLQLMARSSRTIRVLTSFDPSRYACEAPELHSLVFAHAKEATISVKSDQPPPSPLPSFLVSRVPEMLCSVDSLTLAVPIKKTAAPHSQSQRLYVCVDGESALSRGAGSVISQLHGLKAFTVLATLWKVPSDIHDFRLSAFLIPRAAKYISTELEGLTLTTHFDLRALGYSSNGLRELSCTLYQTGEEGKLAVERRVRCIAVELSLSPDGLFPFDHTGGKRGFCDALCAEAAKALAAFPRVESVRVKPSHWSWELVDDFHAAAEQAKVRCDHEEPVMRLTRAPR